MKFMILRLMEGVWHTQEPNDPLLLELFGTDTLPTPYRASMPISEVIAELQVRNPEHLIVLDEKALERVVGIAKSDEQRAMRKAKRLIARRFQLIAVNP